MTITLAKAACEFGAGPFGIATGENLAQLGEGDRLIVEFDDCELIFTVIGLARGALHLGAYVTPWLYLHWRCEPKAGRWVLSTHDRQELERVRRR